MTDTKAPRSELVDLGAKVFDVGTPAEAHTFLDTLATSDPSWQSACDEIKRALGDRPRTIKLWRTHCNRRAGIQLAARDTSYELTVVVRCSRPAREVRSEVTRVLKHMFSDVYCSPPEEVPR